MSLEEVRFLKILKCIRVSKPPAVSRWMCQTLRWSCRRRNTPGLNSYTLPVLPPYEKWLERPRNTGTCGGESALVAMVTHVYPFGSVLQSLTFLDWGRAEAKRPPLLSSPLWSGSSVSGPLPLYEAILIFTEFIKQRQINPPDSKWSHVLELRDVLKKIIK